MEITEKDVATKIPLKQGTSDLPTHKLRGNTKINIQTVRALKLIFEGKICFRILLFRFLVNSL